MSLLTKPVADIQWADVLAFCDRCLPESAILDYKADLPAHLANTIVAMANTHGGMILIGVSEEPQTTRPLPPYEGVTIRRGLQETVQQTIAAHVRPLLEVTVATPVNSDATRCFIVLRVTQSVLAPHAVDGQAVYVRTGNRNDPDAVANPDRIGWLLNHREQSILERERLLAQADARCAAMTTDPGEPLLTISVCPSYPTEPFTTPNDLLQLYRDIRVRDNYGTSDHFPIAPDPRTVQDGVVGVWSRDDTPAFFYAELGCSGHYFTRQALMFDLWSSKEGDKEPPSAIRVSEIITRVDELLRTANNYYESIGYGGPLAFSLSIKRANEVGLEAGLGGGMWLGGSPAACPDPEIRYATTIGAASLMAERRKVIVACARRVFNSYSMRVDDALVERFVTQLSEVPFGDEA